MFKIGDIVYRKSDKALDILVLVSQRNRASDFSGVAVGGKSTVYKTGQFSPNWCASIFRKQIKRENA